MSSNNLKKKKYIYLFRQFPSPSSYEPTSSLQYTLILLYVWYLPDSIVQQPKVDVYQTTCIAGTFNIGSTFQVILMVLTDLLQSC